MKSTNNARDSIGATAASHSNLLLLVCTGAIIVSNYFTLSSGVTLAAHSQQPLAYPVVLQSQPGSPPSFPGGGQRLVTVKEAKQQWRLPCNYVHDGFYVKDSNDFLHQNYLTMMSLDDDDIPIMVEVGGHDGISKSLSLKSSICLHVNTLLIEAAPANYDHLRQSRAYDWTVNAALCESDYVHMKLHKYNTGRNSVGDAADEDAEDDEKGPKVRCTTIDQEIDRMAATLPPSVPKSKIKLIFLVLDIEGYEHVAIKGIQDYSPMKACLEVKHDKAHAAEFEAWQKKHKLEDPVPNYNDADSCFNFGKTLDKSFQDPNTKKVFFGSRSSSVVGSGMTSKAIKDYRYMNGQELPQ